MCSFVLIGFSKGRKQLVRKTSVSFVTSVVKRKRKRIYLIYLIYLKLRYWSEVITIKILLNYY